MSLLKYPPFAAVPEISKAANNDPVLKAGMSGSGVEMLQSALLDLGYKMPKTLLKKNGYPDGIYGAETKNAVEKFQEKYLLHKDGVAGKSTILLLDHFLVLKHTKSILPSKSPKFSTPIDNNYKIGTISPSGSADRGAGAFDSKKTEFTMWSLKQLILSILPPQGSSASIFIGYDASMHMLHYLKAEGVPYKIRLENMIKDVPSARKRFRNEITQAKIFVESLGVGQHNITSKNREGGYNLKDESKNWFFAVGGYSLWGKGTASVKKNINGQFEYQLDFEYHFYDRYNWDKGKSVTIADIVITDEFMGEFHRQGLAKEYDEIGMIKRKFTWKKGENLPEIQFAPMGER